MSDTDDILPVSPVVVKTSHGDIQVSPMVVGVLLGPFARIIKPVMNELGRGGGIYWIDLLSEHGDTLMDAAALATGIEPEKVRALQIDEAITLLAAILEVNADFFARRGVPALDGLTLAVHRLAGSMASSLSSPTATTETESSIATP